MRELFDLDLHNYPANAPVYTRHAVRAMISRNGLWLLQRDKQGYYKLPGGGVEAGETHEEALARELMEETGMQPVPGSILPLGRVTERRLDNLRGDGSVFEQFSYYYICQVLDTQAGLSLSESEISWGLQPVWIALEDAIRENRGHENGPWMIRDTRFLEWFRDEIANEKEDAAL